MSTTTDLPCAQTLSLALEAYCCCQAGVEASCGTMFLDIYERYC